MRYRLGIFILSILLLVVSTASAQSNAEKAAELGKQAVTLEDNGNYGGALKLLAEAQKLDPNSLTYPYEMAYSYYSQKEYQKAIDVLSGLTASKDVFAKVYQLLGNAYDDNGQTDKAIETYNSGLKLFPDAGELYLESAVLQLGKKNYTKALGFCEQGIKADPSFPSNYYWAARIYCNSTERVWGVIYGELFMNIERNTKRTQEISKLLYDSYKTSITITASPYKANVDFSKQDTIALSKDADMSKFKLPFHMAYGMPVSMALLGETTVDMASLDRIRGRFLDIYFHQLGYDKKYPNALYDYQQTVFKAGHLEAYNHWILMQGDMEAFNAWEKDNRDKWNAFLTWFNANPIKLNSNNRFYRAQYD